MNSHSLDDKIHAFLKTRMKCRQVNKILHSFPSPRFWKEMVIPVTKILEERQDWEKAEPADLELYVSLPYCVRTQPEHCGYCLFPVEVFKGTKHLDTYLDHLSQEGRLYKDQFLDKPLKSVYIGGGTPNLLKTHQYPQLMKIIREVFNNIPSEIGITLEGIPQLFTREKLEIFKEVGINRISMGAQQLNPELSGLSGRRQRPEHVFQTVACAKELGLDCNVDLIFGWPRQTMDTMLKDLEALVATGVPHITHYELNVGGQSDFALNRRHELPSVDETRAMYHAACDLLKRNGYQQLTTYDFEKRIDGEWNNFVYEEGRRNFRRTEIRGWGFAAITDLPGYNSAGGWCYMNHSHIQRYSDALLQKKFPVASGFHREIEDLRLSLLFRNLQCLRVDREAYRKRFKIDLVDEHAPVWSALLEYGLIEIESDEIRLSAEGSYFVPLIQTALANRRVETLVERYSRKVTDVNSK